MPWSVISRTSAFELRSTVMMLALAPVLFALALTPVPVVPIPLSFGVARSLPDPAQYEHSHFAASQSTNLYSQSASRSHQPAGRTTYITSGPIETFRPSDASTLHASSTLISATRPAAAFLPASVTCVTVFERDVDLEAFAGPFPTAFPNFPSGFGPSQLLSVWLPAASSLTSLAPTSGPSQTTILALSITLGVSAILAAVIVTLVILRRRSRSAASRDTVDPFVVVEEKETKGGSNVDTESHGSHNIRRVRNVSYRRDTRGNPLLDASPSCESLPPSSTATPDEDRPGSPSPRDSVIPAPDESVLDLDGTGLAQHGSAMGPRTSFTPSPVGVADPGPQPSGTQEGAPGPRTKLPSRLRPPPAPSGPPEQPAVEAEGTMLVRLPVTLAHRVMATMSDPPGRGDIDFGGSEDDRDSEPLPAYEPRRPPSVDGPPP